MRQVIRMDRAEPSEKASATAGTRGRSEGVTLVVAVAFAVTLGVAVGIWINVRLTPTSSAGAPRSMTRLLPDAHASATPAPAAQPSPCDGCETSPARVPDDKEDEARREAEPLSLTGDARAATPDAPAEPGRPVEVANVVAEARGATDSGAVAAASPEPSRPVAWEVGPLRKPGARAAARANAERGAAQSVERAAGRGPQARPMPCALYVSANSLGVSVGGAAPLIVGGPGVGVRINVSTPHWSALAVIYEGPAGRNGWLRYSVRSVSRKPGLYTVHVSSPCGSQAIPVTVK